MFAIGDDPVKGREPFARDHGVAGAQFTAIGALSRAVVGYFDWERKDDNRRGTSRADSMTPQVSR